jgi:hypothetical protein
MVAAGAKDFKDCPAICGAASERKTGRFVRELGALRG